MVVLLVFTFHHFHQYHTDFGNQPRLLFDRYCNSETVKFAKKDKLWYRIDIKAMDSVLPVTVAVSLIVGALIAFLIFGSYFRKRKSEVESIAKPEKLQANQNLSQKQPLKTNKKSQSKIHSHSHAADKVGFINPFFILTWSNFEF